MLLSQLSVMLSLFITKRQYNTKWGNKGGGEQGSSGNHPSLLGQRMKEMKEMVKANVSVTNPLNPPPPPRRPWDYYSHATISVLIKTEYRSLDFYCEKRRIVFYPKKRLTVTFPGAY